MAWCTGYRHCAPPHDIEPSTPSPFSDTSNPAWAAQDRQLVDSTSQASAVAWFAVMARRALAAKWHAAAASELRSAGELGVVANRERAATDAFAERGGDEAPNVLCLRQPSATGFETKASLDATTSTWPIAPEAGWVKADTAPPCPR